MKAINQYWVSSSIVLHIIFWDRIKAQEFSFAASVNLGLQGHMHIFHFSSGETNLDSKYLTEPLPKIYKL